MLTILQTKIARDPRTHGSAFVPIILGSDKTTVSVATGQTDYYPLYLSIGNLHNNIRRSHRGGVALAGFLAIAQSDCLFYVYRVANLYAALRRQLRKSTATALGFEGSAVSYFTPRLLASSPAYVRECRSQRSFDVPMGSIGG